MTLSALQSELARLLYRDPQAPTNVLAIENKGSAILFSFDESELRHEITMLSNDVAQLEGKLMDARRERDEANERHATLVKAVRLVRSLT